MKTKKILAFILATVMTMMTFTGCMSDPVADELEQFMNKDMKEVSQIYSDVSKELSSWSTDVTPEDMKKAIDESIIPKFEKILTLLDDIKLEQSEVKNIKEKYQKTIEVYKEGYEMMSEALETGDVELSSEAQTKVSEGLTCLNEYNDALEKLAKEKDMTVTY